MAYQPKDGNGALFKNDKGDNAARPDYRGDLMVGGVVYELSAWIKSLPSDSTKKFMSLSAKPKQDRQSQGEPPRRQPPARNSYADRDSDAPF